MIGNDLERQIKKGEKHTSSAKNHSFRLISYSAADSVVRVCALNLFFCIVFDSLSEKGF